MGIDSPIETIFYTIVRTIKVYRKFCQKNIDKAIGDITTDQTLVLEIVKTHPELAQKEIAALIFKDFASLTRIIDLMVKKKYLARSINEDDRRRFHLTATSKGDKALEKLVPTIRNNRNSALKGLTEKEIQDLRTMLRKIITNCTLTNSDEGKNGNV